MKKTGIILIIAGLTIILIVVAIWLSASLSSPQEPEFIPTIFEPITFTGSDSKTTPSFEVTTEEWIVEWSYIPDSKYPQDADFNFLIYPKGETTWYITSTYSANIVGSTYSHEGPGEYYIKVLAYSIDNWEITIRPA